MARKKPAFDLARTRREVAKYLGWAPRGPHSPRQKRAIEEIVAIARRFHEGTACPNLP